MQRITIHMLNSKLAQINTALGTPQSPYTHSEDGLKANAGCIFLDNAYGGYSIRRMGDDTGESLVVTSGYFPKRQILIQLEAFYNGILSGRQRLPQVS